MSETLRGEAAEGAAKASRRRFFGGDTVQQALVQAANAFHLDPEEIAFRVLDKRHGFLKVRKKVLIEVDADAPRRERPPASALGPEIGNVAPPRVVPPAEEEDEVGPPLEAAAVPAAEEPQRRERGRGRGERERGSGRRKSGDDTLFDDGDQPTFAMTWDESMERLRERPRPVSERYDKASGPAADAAAHGIALLLRISSLDLKGEVYNGSERLEVDLVGSDVDWCFADDGEFLMAAEHLLPRVIRSLSGEATPCRVDCDNFHDLREERLRTLAQRVAQDVRKNGKARVLAPMNPADRRIVHTTLADDPGVVTESLGDGYFKRISIRPM